MKRATLIPTLVFGFLGCSPTGKTMIFPPSSDTGDLHSGGDIDQDGDGWPASQDCNDDNPAVHPSATEVCNGVDDDCIGGVDDGVGTMWYADLDADLYGGDPIGLSCEAPERSTHVDGDCDDDNADVYPDSPARVDGQDSDCDGRKDWLLVVSVAVDDAGELCFNDEFIGDTGTWTDGKSYEVWLHSGPNTVGIYGWDVGRFITAAIAHMEISDGSVWVTNDTWRYDPEPDQDGVGKVGWCRPGFDDSDWDFAKDLGPIGDPENPWGSAPSVFPESSPAHWIWDHFPVDLNTQYLRLDFELP